MFLHLNEKLSMEQLILASSPTIADVKTSYEAIKAHDYKEFIKLTPPKFSDKT